MSGRMKRQMKGHPFLPPAASLATSLGTSLVVLALAGCKTVGPDYHLSQNSAYNAPAAQGAFLGTSNNVASGDPLPGRWWHLFDDPVLDKLETQAVAANTDLRVAAANLARAKDVTTATAGEGDPQIGVSARGERARLPAETYLLHEPLPVFNLGGAGVEIGYQLDLFGRIRRAVEAARANEEAVAATQDAVKVTVAAEVARAYVSACAAGEDLELAQKAVEVQQRALDVTQRLQAAGRESAMEVTQARARHEQLEAVLPIHMARRRAALFRLAYLLGRAPADYPREAEDCREIPMVKGVLPVGDGAALLRRRPDIRAAERQLASVTARIGVATAELYPDVTLGAGAGTNGLLEDFGKAAANFWNFGGLIHWSFPTRGARARVRAAGAEADAALARFDGTVLGALRETETSLSTYGHDIRRAEALTEARRQAETGAAQAERLRKAGRSPLLADLGARQGMVGAKAAESEAQAALANDQINLFLALGGGW